MPHKCLKCGKIYSDGEINLMNACACGARFFLYSRTEGGFSTGGNLETAEEKAFGLKDEISVERVGDTVLLRKKEFEEEEPAKEPKAPESKSEIKSMWEEKKKPEIPADKVPESKSEIKSMWEEKKKTEEIPVKKKPEIKEEEKRKPEISVEKKPEVVFEEKKKPEEIPVEKKPEVVFEEKKKPEEIPVEKKPEIKEEEKRKPEISVEKKPEVVFEEKKKPEEIPVEKKPEEIPVEKKPEIKEEEKRKPEISVEKKPEVVFKEKKKVEDLKKPETAAKVPSEDDDLEWLEKEFKLSEKGLVSLDVETLKIFRKGKYEIDVAALMAGKPLVIETKKGVYYIHLPTAMKKKKKI